MLRSPFNSYDEKDFRQTITGNQSSRAEDEAILNNLRQRWAEKLDGFSDVELINEYDKFAFSDMFGDNDERFLEWLAL